MIGYRAELRVEYVHPLASRSLLMLSGSHVGEPLAVGDAIVIRKPDGGSISTEITTIEMHSRRGMTTVGVPGDDVGDVPVGSTLLLQ